MQWTSGQKLSTRLGCSPVDCDRDASRVEDEVALAAELAAVHGIRAGFSPPAWR
jgi:hypothetical protein